MTFSPLILLIWACKQTASRRDSSPVDCGYQNYFESFARVSTAATMIVQWWFSISLSSILIIDEVLSLCGRLRAKQAACRSHQSRENSIASRFTKSAARLVVLGDFWFPSLSLFITEAIATTPADGGDICSRLLFVYITSLCHPGRSLL